MRLVAQHGDCLPEVVQEARRVDFHRLVDVEVLRQQRRDHLEQGGRLVTGDTGNYIAPMLLPGITKVGDKRLAELVA
ncbi:MAG: hypothetical protein WA418_22775 [Bradyrhizobium sp.]